jgi:hypothetical protein
LEAVLSKNTLHHLGVKIFLNKCIENKKDKTYMKQLENYVLYQIFVLGISASLIVSFSTDPSLYIPITGVISVYI